MKSFDDRVQLGYESKINEKTKTLNQLEFEVFLLKKETKGIEKEIELKKLKQKKLKMLIIIIQVIIFLTIIIISKMRKS